VVLALEGVDCPDEVRTVAFHSPGSSKTTGDLHRKSVLTEQQVQRPWLAELRVRQRKLIDVILLSAHGTDGVPRLFPFRFCECTPERNAAQNVGIWILS
jgi:hypothetical protein